MRYINDFHQHRTEQENLDRMFLSIGTQFSKLSNTINERDILARKPWLDARQFGVKADGETDDAGAINDAIDSLESTGGSILLPPGTILIDSSIILKRTQTPAVDHSHINLFGLGRGVTNIKLGSGFDDYAIKVIGESNSYSVVKLAISDLSIDGNNESSALGGIYINYARFITLDHLDITQFVLSTADGVYVKDAYNISHKHVRVAMGTSAGCKGNCGFEVYSTIGTSNATNILYLHCLSQFNDIGYHVHTDASVISHNFSFINAAAVRNETSNIKVGPDVKSVYISSSNVESSLVVGGQGLTDYGIHLVGTSGNEIHNVTIENNFINQCTNGVYARYVNGLKISNNRFRGTRQANNGGYEHGFCVNIQDCEQVLYDDLNTIDNTGATDFYYENQPTSGFLASGSDDPRFTRVRMHNTTGPSLSSGSWHTVELDTEGWAIGGTADTTNDCVTGLQKGYYRASGVITYDDPVDAKFYKAALYVDAVQKCQNMMHSGCTDDISVPISDILKIAGPTTCIYLKAYHNSGVDKNLISGGTRTYLTVERIVMNEE